MDNSILSKAYQQPQTNILASVCALAAKMDDVIDLSVGDPNFTTPQPIITAAFKTAQAGMTHYTAGDHPRAVLLAVPGTGQVSQRDTSRG